MIEQFRIFLGPARLRAFFLLLALTGLASLVFNALDGTWTVTAQMLMVLLFIVGSIIIIGGRLDSDTRNRWLAILIPAVGLLLLGFFVLPQFVLPLAGAAVGWIVAGAFLFRSRMPKEFQTAIKHMRKGNYHDAVQSMNAVIREDAQNESYYRLRAEILRLWGKLDRARKDYEKMTAIAPDSAVAFNGLAEVNLQSGEFEAAREAGLKAFELAPTEWVAAYNLGMIEDRLGEAQATIENLNLALLLKVPDMRHRLLIHLYLARAYSRLGEIAAAEEQIVLLKKQRSGLEEWQNLLKHDEAAALRAVLAADIELAQALVGDELAVERLAE